MRFLPSVLVFSALLLAGTLFAGCSVPYGESTAFPIKGADTDPVDTSKNYEKTTGVTPEEYAKSKNAGHPGSEPIPYAEAAEAIKAGRKPN